MRQPFGLTAKLASYVLGRKIRGRDRYPVVMMLEPLHTCNLACLGCTPDRYAGPMGEWMTLEQCFSSIDECDAPIISVCGGEPLVYRQIVELVEGIVARDKFVILCTNAILMERYLDKFPRSNKVSFAIHIDGGREIHDKVTKRPGCFDEAVAAARAAKKRGFRVTTNTTVFAETDIDDLAEALTYFKRDVGVDALLISPGYDFDQTASDFFLKREQTRERFRRLLSLVPPAWFGNSRLYLDFLQGHADLTCTAWGNPTRTPKGWQGPCYMLRDGYYGTYGEMLEKVDWTKYGPESDDPRCRNCMVHCGFEPTVATGRGVPIFAQVKNAFQTVL